MSAKNKKQFGIWMDSQHATIVGRAQTEAGEFVILGMKRTKARAATRAKMQQIMQKEVCCKSSLKDITAHMQNADELHVTGTGQVQEQFIKYMGETPQYKNTVAKESTSKQMSDDKLLEYFTSTFN